MARNQTAEAFEFLYGPANDVDSEGGLPIVKNAFPAYRVFLGGWEITQDVTSLTIANHVGKQPNSCRITLQNERDKYTLTTEDMLYLANIDPTITQLTQQGQPVEGPRYHFPAVSPENFAIVWEDTRMSNSASIKRQVFTLKQQHRSLPGIRTILIDRAGNRTLSGEQGTLPRYPFVDGKSIWHANDHMRIFLRDVFDPDIWYWGFSGLVTDIGDEVMINGHMLLNIAAEDPTKMLRYSRTTTSQAVVDPNAYLPQDISGFSAWGNIAQNHTFVEIIEGLVLGTLRPSQQEDEAEELPDVQPDASEDDLLRDALNAGIPGIDRSIPGDTGAEIRANMTQDEQDRAIAFIQDWRARSEQQRFNESQVITVEYRNRWGDVRQRRFGKDAGGAFKSNTGDIDLLDAPFDNEDGTVTADQPQSRRRRAGRPGAYLFSLGEDPQAPEPTKAIDLPTWQRIVSQRVRSADITLMLDSNANETEVRERLAARGNRLLTTEDIITAIGEDPVNFPVDCGRVLMFLPVGAGEIGNEVMSVSFNQSVPLKAGPMDNRMQLIYQTVERLEFVFYCTGRGDLVVEFPLFDFDPRDFASDDERREGIPGQLVNDFVIENSDMRGSTATDSDAAVRTVVQITPSVFNYQDVQSRVAQTQHAVVVTLPALFPIYGTRAEQDMRNFYQTGRAAELGAHIMLSRINADAFSVNLPINPRFTVGLNRPILWKKRNHIGTTQSVIHNITWMGDCRTTLGLNHLRGWQGKLQEPRGGSGVQYEMVYEPIGGAASQPLNYKRLFQRLAPIATPDVNGSAQQELPAESSGGQPAAAPAPHSHPETPAQESLPEGE